MRPIRLTLQGFESYKDKTVIDFTKLPEKGLFLITGDTGSGKTSIFDAIVYALFDVSNANDKDDPRNNTNLRSDFADENIPTYVEFEFQNNGKTYRVRRDLEYVRNKQRGPGTTVQAAQAVLEFVDDAGKKPPVTGIKNVTDVVKKILGLDRNQFCQIDMIEQGKFEKLLTSEEKDKQVIFRTLFNTQNYMLFQCRINEMANESEKNVNATSEKIVSLFNDIDIGENDGSEEYAMAKRIKSAAVGDIQSLETLSKYLEKDDSAYASLKDEQRKCVEELTVVSLKIKDAENYNNTIKHIQGNEDKLKNFEADLKVAETRARDIPDLEMTRTSCMEFQVIIENSIPEYESLEKKETELKKKKTDAEDASRRHSEKSEECEKINKDLLSLQSVIDNIRDPQVLISKLDSDIERLRSRIGNLNRFSETNGEYEAESKKLSSYQMNYVSLQKKSNSASSEYASLLSSYNSHIAGVLASSMKIGMPCPVCGSKEHPHPAHLPENAPSETEVNESKMRSDECERKATEAASLASSQNGKVQNILKNLKAIFRDYAKENEDFLNGANADFDSDEDKFDNLSALKLIESEKSKLEKLLAKTKEDLKVQKSNEEKKREAEKKIKSLTEEKEKLEKELSYLLLRKEKLNSEIVVLSKNLKDGKANLQFASLDEAKTHLNNMKQTVDGIDKSIGEINDELNKSRQNVASCNSVIEALKIQLASFKQYDEEALSDEQSKLITRKNSLDDQISKLYNKIENNKKNIGNLRKIVKESEGLRKRANLIRNLADLCQGRRINGNRCSADFESYVQAKYLDRVLKHSNARLRLMTNEKYELCHEKIESGDTSYVLKLFVKDHYTGKTRDVKTLSGGEKFQASLSLALGLADEIQSNSGGLAMETLFIDEGFGTLDANALSKAITILQNLSYNNDKLIGIISHVEELKAKIDDKICVKKDIDGTSHVSYGG